MLIAITRAVSPTLAECEITHRARQPIDVGRVEAEHAEYEKTLRLLGATIVRAPCAPELPDAVFVEDTAVVLDDVAIITRPGAASRAPEIESMDDVLRGYMPTVRIQAPGTLDGGDVLRVGRKLYVGLSSRTNCDAAAQLAALARKYAYEVVPVTVTGCLHLKSAVTRVGERTLLINDSFVRREPFGKLEMLAVDPSEPDAANALLVGESLMYPSHFPRTAERLDRAGVEIVQVPCAEIAKAEGGLTCCSVLFESNGRTT
jgi:dimethylargininase